MAMADGTTKNANLAKVQDVDLFLSIRIFGKKAD